MSGISEARAAARGALTSGKPVWVSWTLHEDLSGRLRSGETIPDAVLALADLPISAFLVNCSAPESVSNAMELLAQNTDRRIGGYANTFHPIPEDWRLDGPNPTDGLLPLRNDLDPDAYADYAAQWLNKGARIIGGCCGTRPAHIRKLSQMINLIEYC